MKRQAHALVPQPWRREPSEQAQQEQQGARHQQRLAVLRWHCGLKFFKGAASPSAARPPDSVALQDGLLSEAAIGRVVPIADVRPPPRLGTSILVEVRKRRKTRPKQGCPKRRPDALLLGRQSFDECTENQGLSDDEIRPDYQLLCGPVSAY